MTRADDVLVVLVTGAGGFLGSNLVARLARDPHCVVISSRGPLRVDVDLETPGAAARLVARTRPHVVAHLAAMTSIGECEADPSLARRINTTATVEMATAAAEIGARFLFFSTDQVFDGRETSYDEAAPTNPLHVYGETKAAAETMLTAVPADRVVLRIALAYGASPTGTRSASEMVLAAAAERRQLGLFLDEIRTPVAARFVAEVTRRLIFGEETGVFHVAGAEAVSRYEFGLRVCRVFGLPPDGLTRTSLSEWTGPPRPANLSLATDRTSTELSLPPIAVLEGLRAER